MRFVEPWAGRFRLNTYVVQRPNALPAEQVEAIRRQILESPFLGAAQLEGGFTGTLGFSVRFRREALQDVIDTFPAFGFFLDAALLPACNAFILNPLVVQEGRGVQAHVDGSLGTYSPTTGCPAAVTVLYVQVPENLEGGRLRLFRRGGEVASVTPTTGTMLSFRGDLAHEVTPVAGAAPTLETARVSLVVEQYRLSAPDLALVPPFTFFSHALEALRG